MRWRAVRDIGFVARADGDPQERVTLTAGEVVDGCDERAMLGADAVAWKRHQERTAREEPGAKPVAILWRGKVRLVRAPGDVVAAPNLRKIG